MVEPAAGAECGEGLRWASPGVARDGADEGRVVERDGGEWVCGPEGFWIGELARPERVEEFLVGDVFAADAREDAAVDPDEVILGVEVVEGGVFGDVEPGEDEVADRLGAG